MNVNTKHLKSMILEATEHKGTSFFEVYQNDLIFKNGFFEEFTDIKFKPKVTLYLKRIDLESEKVCLDDSRIYEEKDLTKSQYLSFFFDISNDKSFPQPFGVFYAIEKPTYQDLLYEQIISTQAQTAALFLDNLLEDKNSWEIN